MQETSALYQEIIKDPRHRKETKAVIAGTEYSGSNLVSVSTSGGLFSEFGIGNCSSRQISLSILPVGEIPRQAKLQVFVRLVSGIKVSEWIPKGEFFISTRKKDKRTGCLNIKGYDAMLKADDVWLTQEHATENWPMPQREAVADIAERIGVPVDSRTVLSEKYPVDYPVDENGDLTMREVLGFIAVSNAGNWIITDAGALRLIRYDELPAQTNYLVSEYGDTITFGGVRILV